MADNDNHLDLSALDAEVDLLLDGLGGADELANYIALAELTATELAKPGALALDPPDPAYWRAIIAELRRRAIRLV